MTYPLWMYILAGVLFVVNIIEFIVGLLDRTAEPD